LSFKHQIKRAGFRQFIRTAIRTGIPDLIGTPAGVAVAAVHERVHKCLLMTRIFPRKWIHQDRTVETLHIISLIDIGAPPGVDQIIFQFNADGSVIIKALEAPVNFGTRINDTSAFTEGDKLF
jgi:hypothetical protein